MCDLNKNPNLNKINHKNKRFNSFITNLIIHYYTTIVRIFLFIAIIKYNHTLLHNNRRHKH